MNNKRNRRFLMSSKDRLSWTSRPKRWRSAKPQLQLKLSSWPRRKPKTKQRPRSVKPDSKEMLRRSTRSCKIRSRHRRSSRSDRNRRSSHRESRLKMLLESVLNKLHRRHNRLSPRRKNL